ncbi:MAG: DUF3172 domain-containing protein [Leptolyngbya sp. BL-A-14]
MRSTANNSGKFSTLFNHMTLAIVAIALLIGISLGMGLTYNTNSTPQNVNSRQFFDEMAPDSSICMQYGASAITLNTRFFVTFNPFSVYVSQPKMQPGCVLRNSDWAILEQKNLLTADQERECKNSLNTFGFTGKLENSPQIDCVYRNDAAGNLFLKQAK